MNKCGNCFRFTENWRDARAKGLADRGGFLGAYSFPPRRGIATWCNADGKGKNLTDEPLTANERGCNYYKPRWAWNAETWWKWHFKRTIEEIWRTYIRVPFGARRKPVLLRWIDSYDGRTDNIIPNGEPECPRCGEYPYSTEQCVFCGQRFIQEGADNAV